MTEYAVHAASPAGGWRQHRAGFVASTIAAVFMTVIGALGTDAYGLATRLTYWIVVMWTGAMIASGVTSAVHGWGKLRRFQLPEVLLIAVLTALPLTLAVTGAGMLLLDMGRPSLRGMAVFFGLVVFISAILTAISYAFAARPLPATAAPLPPSPDQPFTPPLDAPRLADRLPHGMRGATIIALEAEDHYLRVHLDDGRSALILLRLSDAIAELPAGAGSQTHRSWWVARGAVQGFSRGDGRAMLNLRPALEVPVSRSYYKAISEAGWLA